MSGLLRKIIGLAAVVAVPVAAIHLAQGIISGGEDNVSYTKVPVRSDKTKSRLKDFKIAFITDVHLYNIDRLEGVVERLNEEGINLLALGGDYARGRHAYGGIKVLSKVKTTHGIFGVEGNHDNRRELFPLMHTLGITPLFNEGVSLGNGLYIGGVGDFKNSKCDFDSAVKAAGVDEFCLLICHNPDSTMMQNTHKIDLTISGHTHGGEASLFGEWAPLLSVFAHNHGVTNYGQRFSGGYAKSHDGSDVYVSCGLGSHAPFRVYVPREVTIFTFL